MPSTGSQVLQSYLQTTLIYPQVTTHNLSPSEDKSYVHPLVNRSPSKLSFKSLELCTESLGSETGSDITDNFSPSLNHSKPRQFATKLTRKCSFPPSITSISGSVGVRVRPHREHGRVVLTAEAVASNSSCLQAERVDGRLRLCMTIDSRLDCDYEEDDDQMLLEHGGDIKCGNNYGGVSDQNLVGGLVHVTGELETRRWNEGCGRGRKEMQSWGAVWVASI